MVSISSTHGREECILERDHQEDFNVGGMIILKYVLREVGWGNLDWIHPAHCRDQWSALVNTIMNLRLPQKSRNS
jgi:hypothetical protein